MNDEVLAGKLARIEEGVKSVRSGIDRMNGSILRQQDQLCEHERVHGKLWGAIGALRVRDAYVAGLLVVLNLLFGGFLTWLVKS